MSVIMLAGHGTWSSVDNYFTVPENMKVQFFVDDNHVLDSDFVNAVIQDQDNPTLPDGLTATIFVKHCLNYGYLPSEFNAYSYESTAERPATVQNYRLTVLQETGELDELFTNGVRMNLKMYESHKNLISPGLGITPREPLYLKNIVEYYSTKATDSNKITLQWLACRVHREDENIGVAIKNKTKMKKIFCNIL